MYISNHDNRILNMLVEERTRLQSSSKPYHKAAEIASLTKHIVAIRNTIEYASINTDAAVVCEDSSSPEAVEKVVVRKPIVLKRGESISLKMC